MKTTILLLLIVYANGYGQDFFSERIRAQSTLGAVFDSLQQSDTLYLNFYISPSEFGSMHTGILLFKKGNSIFGKRVLYNYGVSLLPNRLIKMHHVKALAWDADSVVTFYNKFKANYFVLKDEWQLNEKQISYIKNYLLELEKFKKGKGFSNAPDFYTVMLKEKSFIVLDLVGKWNKCIEINQIMGL